MTQIIIITYDNASKYYSIECVITKVYFLVKISCKLLALQKFSMIIMITKQKITIYLKYQNIDNFARIASTKEKNILGDKDWVLIENLIQDIHLLKNNMVSSEMKDKIENKIKDYTEGENELIEKLISLKF